MVAWFFGEREAAGDVDFGLVDVVMKNVAVEGIAKTLVIPVFVRYFAMDVGLPFLPVFVILSFIFIFVLPIQPRNNGLKFRSALFGIMPVGMIKAIMFGFLEIFIDDRFHVVVFFGSAEIYVVTFTLGYL